MTHYIGFDESDYTPNDDYDESMDEICPLCHKTYDEIDYDYQICHLCKFDNSEKQNP